MSINVINNEHCFKDSGAQKTESPFSPPFNNQIGSIFDANIFPKKFIDLNDLFNSDIFKASKPENKEDDGMKLIAHRGYSEKAPENTIPAFIAAAENGYNTVECDIEWTKDGVPVILHDSTINRTARKQNGWRLFFPKKCSNLTYDELLKYDFGSWFSKDFKGTKIPNFTELLDCANEYDLNLYIELKETGDFDDKKAETLIQAVCDAGLDDRVTWISFNENYLKTISELAPNARLGYLSKKNADKNTIEILKSLQTGENEVFLDIKANKISKTSSEMLKNAGFDFEAWTVDNSDMLDSLSDYDCKGITTDKITEDDIEDYYDR